MLQNRRPGSEEEDDDDDDDPATTDEVRDIHVLTSPRPPPPPQQQQQQQQRSAQSWETNSHPPSTLSEIVADHFSTMSREFSDMVVAGATIPGSAAGEHEREGGRQELEETNPLAIVPDNNPPLPSPRRRTAASEEVPAQYQLKKEEVESKIAAWQTAEVAKINNKLKRQEVVINGWESEQVEKATYWFKKVERKLEEQRARTLEKMQNDMAKARRKAEEKRASAEGKRGIKVGRVLELANFMRAVGRAPSKRSFF